MAGKIVCEFRGVFDFSLRVEAPGEYGEGAKLVRLFSAAPALLEAAETVRDAWESGDLAGAVRQLSAAIRAARGEG